MVVRKRLGQAHVRQLGAIVPVQQYIGGLEVEMDYVARVQEGQAASHVQRHRPASECFSAVVSRLLYRLLHLAPCILYPAIMVAHGKYMLHSY